MNDYKVIIKQSVHSNNCAPIPSDIKEDILTKLDAESLKEIFKLTLDSLDKALLFIESNQLEQNIERIDYILYLAGYFVYHKSLYAQKELELVEWVKNTSFGNRSNKRREAFIKLLNL